MDQLERIQESIRVRRDAEPVDLVRAVSSQVQILISLIIKDLIDKSVFVFWM